MGFSWGGGDSPQYYEFKVLPSCYVFTRLLRLLKHWWSQDLIAIIYLDGIAALNGEAAAMSASIQELIWLC